MRDLSLVFSSASNTFDIADYGGVLVDSAYKPAQPVYKYVEIPGREFPLDISRAATGNLNYDMATCTFVVAFVGGDSIAANDAQAQLFVLSVNGKTMGISALGVSEDDSFNVSVTGYERVGEYVRITIEAVMTQ